MILELIGFWVVACATAAIISDVIIPWARRVINSVVNAVSSVLYAVQDVLNAVFTVYVEDGFNNPLVESRRVPLSELPQDIQRELRSGQRVKVGMGS